MKITQSLFVASALALSFGPTAVNAQNVGIGVTNPPDLRNENAKLKANTTALTTRLEALEKTVVRAESQPGEVHPVALNQ
jgi:hypothetical protein